MVGSGSPEVDIQTLLTLKVDSLPLPRWLTWEAECFLSSYGGGVGACVRLPPGLDPMRLDLNEVRDGLTYFLSRVKGRDQWHQITDHVYLDGKIY